MLVHISVFVCIGGGDMVGGCVCGGCVGVVCEWGDGDGSENYSLKTALSFTGSHKVPL